jgi:hypothetical protein
MACCRLASDFVRPATACLCVCVFFFQCAVFNDFSLGSHVLYMLIAMSVFAWVGSFSDVQGSLIGFVCAMLLWLIWIILFQSSLGAPWTLPLLVFGYVPGG